MAAVAAKADERSPLLPLLLRLLSALHPGETVNKLLQRVAAQSQQQAAATATAAASATPVAAPTSSTPAQTMSDLSETMRLLIADHDLSVIGLTREALLTRALREALRCKMAALPRNMWYLVWDKDARRTVHGPFSAEEMERWRGQAVFQRKGGHALDGAAVGGSWTPAASISSFL